MGLIDLTGQKFGKLLVMSRNFEKQGPTRWNCKCDCGNATVVIADNLKRGHTTSCGHCEKFEDLGDGVSRCVLPNGKYFLFDTEDLDIVREHKWNIPPSGYVETTIYEGGKQRVCRLHRRLLEAPDRYFIDHINGIRWDNRKINLRVATNKDNIRNARLSRANTSGYKGVIFDRRRGKYYAAICVNGQKKFLGYFIDPVTAARAYDRAAVFYFGVFARPNF